MNLVLKILQLFCNFLNFWEKKYAWRDSNLANYKIYLTLKRDELLGKVVGVHYNKFKFNSMYSDRNVLRKNIYYSFGFENKKFGFNPS